MKRLIKYLIAFLLFFVVIPNVNAARQVCSKSAMSEMKTKAYQISLNYELKEREDGSKFFEITVANIPKEIDVLYQGSYIGKNDEGKSSIDLLEEAGGTTLEFDMYVAYGYPCVQTKVSTKRLTLPKYNKYSELDLCIEYEEFPLCNKWYQGNIKSFDEFIEKLDQYRESLNKKPTEREIKEKKFFEKIIDFYTENALFTIPITILLIVAIIFLVVKTIIRRKQRIKLKY